MERGDIESVPFFATISVVIVKGDGRDKLRTEDLPDGIRERGLPGTAVTDNPDDEDDRQMSNDLLEIRSLVHAGCTKMRRFPIKNL